MASTEKLPLEIAQQRSPAITLMTTDTPSSKGETETTSFASTLLVSNIHCPSCVSYVEDLLQPLSNILTVDVSIVDQTVRVTHMGSMTASIITKELVAAAFDVRHVTVHDSTGHKISEIEPQLRAAHRAAHPMRPLSRYRAERKHIENCKACQVKPSGRQQRVTTPWSSLRRTTQSEDPEKQEILACPSDEGARQSRVSNDKTVTTGLDGIIDHPSDTQAEFVATLSIAGMTCASCPAAITKELESLDFVRSVSINLLANNGSISFRGPKSNVDKVVEAVDDVGYEASVDDVKEITAQPANAVTKFRATLSIEGMTCGSCVKTITQGLQELPVSSVNIDLVGNSGMVEFDEGSVQNQILSNLREMGYKATIVSVEDISSPQPVQSSERTVTLHVEGMFCEHCPQRVTSALANAFHTSVTITQRLTVKSPIITVAYIPSAPDLTARRLVSVINSAHEAFDCSVYRPPSFEERSRAIQHYEQRRILLRLVFTFIVAIPTFVIGVVFMSLLPAKDRTRKWFEEPVWVGSVSRIEWALFIMTTPVMFFGADLFHRRTFKELRALWRTGSRVPVLRRFYRFGSMNLLISAGTSVAYFSSIAVLIINARTKPQLQGMANGSATYFDTVTFLTFFILIGKFLEAYSKAKTGDAVALLTSLRPEEALLVEFTRKESAEHDNKRQTRIEKISVDLLEIGDTVNVPRGTSPPADGCIDQAGTFLFDESSLTGESKPVKKVTGDKVFTGSVNVGEPVKIIVSDIGGTSMLDRIVAVVREGQTKRAPIERVADLLTGYFVPVITLVAVLTFVIWLALGQSGTLPGSWLGSQQGGWTFWALEFAIAVFVVACPCGLGLAAPTALFVGGGLAAKQGILVQGGGEAFQEASRLDTIVFDKTGTLTEGKMQVTDCDVLEGNGDVTVSKGIAMALAREMECLSTHPIAQAIAQFCTTKLESEEDIIISDAEIKEVSGQGMTGNFWVQRNATDSAGGKLLVRYEAAIGNQRLLSTVTNRADVVSDFYLSPLLTKHQALGRSTAIFSMREIGPGTARLFSSSSSSSSSSFSASASKHNMHPTMKPTLLFATSDPLRPTTTAVIRTLQEDHKLDVHMCTGDNLTTARAIAAQIGIPLTNLRAGVLPQDKAAYINELQHSDPTNGMRRTGKRRIVAFVGDGTNDTPALTAADVSIALSSGSDVAIGTASFILLNSDLDTILKLVELAKRVFRRVKMNFAWAAVYNACLLPIAAGVLYPAGHWRLGPVWASAAMALSSVSVVLSSLALRLPDMRFRTGRSRNLKTKNQGD